MLRDVLYYAPQVAVLTIVVFILSGIAVAAALIVLGLPREIRGVNRWLRIKREFRRQIN